ncbi:MAG: hypothetical protein ABIF88_00700 [archaeon]
MSLEEFTEVEEVRGKKITVVKKRMTQEQAREMFPYRPFSKYSESRFGGNELYDDVCLLLNGLARRCTGCSAPTKNDYLSENYCPDCDGRSEYNGTDPREKG